MALERGGRGGRERGGRGVREGGKGEGGGEKEGIDGGDISGERVWVEVSPEKWFSLDTLFPIPSPTRRCGGRVSSRDLVVFVGGGRRLTDCAVRRIMVWLRRSMVGVHGGLA